jgi:hypothetical protein
MDLPDDEHLMRSMTELGDPEALFRVSRGRFVAKLAVGILLLVYGVAANYFWWVHGPATFGHFEILLLIVLPLTGAGLLWHMYRQRGLFVLVYSTGLLRLRRGEVDSFPWREIDHVRLKVQRVGGVTIDRSRDGAPIASWLPADVPTFQLWNAGLSVAREDGIEAHFGPALSDYEQLAEEVQKRSFAFLWPLVWDRFLSGASVAFGDLELSRGGIRHMGKFLRWADVKELAIAQGKLSIKQGGKWLPWALIDIQSVPNPHVLFALATEARRSLVTPITEPRPHSAE